MKKNANLISKETHWEKLTQILNFNEYKFNKYLNIKNPIKINYQLSDVIMTTFNDIICTQYKKLPLCNPDFIYLDGPDQFNIKKDINVIIECGSRDCEDAIKMLDYYNPNKIPARFLFVDIHLIAQLFLNNPLILYKFHLYQL